MAQSIGNYRNWGDLLRLIGSSVIVYTVVLGYLLLAFGTFLNYQNSLELEKLRVRAIELQVDAQKIKLELAKVSWQPCVITTPTEK